MGRAWPLGYSPNKRLRVGAKVLRSNVGAAESVPPNPRHEVNTVPAMPRLRLAAASSAAFCALSSADGVGSVVAVVMTTGVGLGGTHTAGGDGDGVKLSMP
ncbi:hypothetical protein WCLP8_3230008 [uncultured Gammaproteobacteria bacterium]